tara:strand:- start:943 stop:1170 length:228 start_codon:yes stop_codon:yes gene_type:complete
LGGYVFFLTEKIFQYFFLFSQIFTAVFSKNKNVFGERGGYSKNNSKSFKKKSYQATGPYRHLILLFFLKKKTKIN